MDCRGDAQCNPPFIFGNMKDTLMFKAPNLADGLALFPLEKEEPKVDQSVQGINFTADEDDVMAPSK